MKTKRTSALFIALMFTLASCSDFTNSGNDKRTANPDTGNKPQAGTNPFPPGYEKPNSGEFSEEKMLVNIGVNVIAPAIRDFALQSELLKNEVNNYCQALSNDTDVQEHEETAQAQWKKAMLTYHFVEAVPVGPASDNGRVINDNLYSWPVLDICGIDQEVLKLDETQATNPKALYNVKGLAALEYLLFEPSLKSRCNPRAYPKTVAWGQKTALEKKQDRCEYAKVLTEELVSRAQELDNAWDVKKNNFSKTLIDGSRFKSLSDATNALTDSLFAIEKLKDLKLGKPMGRHKECTNESGVCPEMAEHPYSGLALRAAEAQMRGFQAVFFGNKNVNSKDFGLDDFLAAKGHPEVAARIQEYLTLAIDSSKELALQGTLQDLIAKVDPTLCKATTVEDRKEPLCGLHAEIRGVSTALKIDVLSILSLRAPPTHQGDND